MIGRFVSVIVRAPIAALRPHLTKHYMDYDSEYLKLHVPEDGVHSAFKTIDDKVSRGDAGGDGPKTYNIHDYVESDMDGLTKGAASCLEFEIFVKPKDLPEMKAFLIGLSKNGSIVEFVINLRTEQRPIYFESYSAYGNAIIDHNFFDYHDLLACESTIREYYKDVKPEPFESVKDIFAGADGPFKHFLDEILNPKFEYDRDLDRAVELLNVVAGCAKEHIFTIAVPKDNRVYGNISILKLIKAAVTMGCYHPVFVGFITMDDFEVLSKMLDLELRMPNEGLLEAKGKLIKTKEKK